ncbi:MAG TPA: hypothetical protein VM032_16850 [Vicinamibacterales bacterium]|nr:hypothetical protein [Vicinamibacterales bacterium]
MGRFGQEAAGAALTVDLEITDLRSVIHQLRALAGHLEDCIPNERDAHLPEHQRLDYITRDRSFSDAEATREARKRATAAGKKGRAR